MRVEELIEIRIEREGGHYNTRFVDGMKAVVMINQRFCSKPCRAEWKREKTTNYIERARRFPIGGV